MVYYIYIKGNHEGDLKMLERIKNALNTYGCTGRAQGEYIAEDRIRITVNGEYFGIWDTVRNTFVD